MSLCDIPLHTLTGEPASLADYGGKALLVVNVSSKCGLTSQYAGLDRLQQRFPDRGFSVLGFPTNHFASQEPGTAEEFATFCPTTCGVSFPLFEKTDVNGARRHPRYAAPTGTPDAEGRRARRGGTSMVPAHGRLTSTGCIAGSGSAQPPSRHCLSR